MENGNLLTCKSKLCDLVMLESVLSTFDEMKPLTSKALTLYDDFVNSSVDDIITKLGRLLESNTRLTSRNMLLANYEKMKDPKHWLKSQLFNYLPKEASLRLQRKIEQMVDLFDALAMKIIDIDPDYADCFFKHLRSRYHQKSFTKYQMWRAKHPHAPYDAIVAYQAQLTADMLLMGILSFDDEPNGEELDGVRMDLLKKKVNHPKEFPDFFKAECAKLRRRSHWAGDLFIIEYEKFLTYLFPNFNKMSQAQHIALYEYDVQLKQIHEDMVRLNPSLARYLQKEPAAKPDELNYFAPAKHMKVMLQKAKWFEQLRTDPKYDHQWIEQFFDDLFASPFGKKLALEWKSSSKHTSFEARIVGCLLQAGVIAGKSKLAIASVIIPSDKKQASSYARYMGQGMKKDYAQWICDYVK